MAPGWERGASFSKQMGWGDYNTPAVANQIVSAPPETSVTPAFVNPGDDLSGDVVLYHREFIRNVTVSGSAGTSTAFELTSYELNPGIAGTFPFLSQIANNFELYEFQGLMFQYVPTYGESGSSSNNLGKVIMATNYDPDASEFASSVQMQNYDYSNSCKPSLGQVHGVETMSSKRASDLMYIREGDVTRDKVFTDIGKFQIATEGVPLAAGATSAIIGELWVTYRIKLSRAKLRDTLGSSMFDCFRSISNGTNIHNNLTASSENDGLVVMTPGSVSRYRATFNDEHVLPGKIYKITGRVFETVAATAGSVTIATLNNLTFVQIGSDATTLVNVATANKTTAENYGIAVCYVKVTAPSTTTSFEFVFGTALVAVGNTFHYTIEEVSPDHETTDIL
jgi:hypothetical protein